MSKTIYVILLEENKYFVYSTDTAEYFDNTMFDYGENVDQHVDEVVKMEIENLFEFPRMYRPVQIVETSWITDVLDIDKTVKKYMMSYGVDNVRGGSYLSPILPEYQYQALHTELSANENIQNEEKMRHFLYNTMLSSELKHFSASRISRGPYRIQSAERTEKDNVSRTALLEKYATWCDKKEKLHAKLNDFLVVSGNNTHNYIMDRSILNNFTTIKKYLNGQDTSNVSYDEIKKIYNTTMVYVNHFIYLIKKYSPELLTNQAFIPPVIHPVYVHFPHFLLDRVILHKNDIEEVEALYLWLGLEGMCFWTLNIIDELMFDLEQIPDNVEWKNDIIQYYVKRHAVKK
jgi:hypothetical protein